MAKCPTFPTLLNEVKTVKISDLKLFGYFNPNVKSGNLKWFRRGKQIGDISIKSHIYSDEPYIILSYYSNQQPINYRVKLVSVSSNLGFGKIWYFVCPVTGKWCRKLYGASKYFLHRDAFKSAMYEKQTYSKYARELDKVLNKYFVDDKLFEEINSKHFTKYYAGKPTKRYQRLMQKIERAEKFRPEVEKWAKVLI